MSLLKKCMAVLDMGTAKYLPEDLRVQDMHGRFHEAQGVRLFNSTPVIITPRGEVPLARIRTPGQDRILSGLL